MYSLRPRTYPLLAILLLLASLLLVTACNHRSDDDSQSAGKTDPDAGTHSDVDDHLRIPSVHTIDFDQAEPGEPSQTHITSSTRRGVISSHPPLDPHQFLSSQDVRAIIPDRPLTASSIAGQTPSPDYHSVRYAPTGDQDSFGVGIQIWTLRDRPPIERLEELQSQFLNTGRPHTESAPGSFISERAALRTFVFPSERGDRIFALSCSIDHCRSWTPLYKLGRTVAQR